MAPEVVWEGDLIVHWVWSEWTTLEKRGREKRTTEKSLSPCPTSDSRSPRRWAPWPRARRLGVGTDSFASAAVGTVSALRRRRPRSGPPSPATTEGALGAILSASRSVVDLETPPLPPLLSVRGLSSRRKFKHHTGVVDRTLSESERFFSYDFCGP